MSKSLCDSCAALCCRYFALPIDNPTRLRDYDDIRWYLIHESVIVYIHKKQWHLGVLTRCRHLQEDNRCGIYETRPRICRGYSTDNCDYHGGEYDFEKLFTSAEQLMEYAHEKLAKEKLKAKKKKRGGKAAKARPARRGRMRARPDLGRQMARAAGRGSASRKVEVVTPFNTGGGAGRVALPVLG